MYPLGLNFFALSSDYKQIQLKEFYYLVRNTSMTYQDLQMMPVYERKFMIKELSDEFQRINEKRKG
jgi:hypothetical protein